MSDCDKDFENNVTLKINGNDINIDEPEDTQRVESVVKEFNID